MIYFYTGGAGEGKSYALIRNINDIAERKEKICIIVPEQYSYESEKMIYRMIGPKRFNSIGSFSFKTLSREIIKQYGDTRISSEYTNKNKSNIIMHMALNDVYSIPDESLFYRRQYKKNGFTELMTDIISEIKQSGISPSELSQKLPALNGRLSEKVNDISKIYLTYEKLLNEFGLKDGLDDITESAHIAARNNYFRDMTVIIDEFEIFTGDQYEMIKTIIAQCKDLYIGLRTENLNAPEFTLFDIVNKTYRNIVRICNDYNKKYKVSKFNSGARFKSDDIKFLSRNIFRNNKNKFETKSENISIFEARDCYSEIEYMCAEIKHLIYEDTSLKYNDIAVMSNNITEYAPLLETAFRRYEIPYFISIEKSVTHTVTVTYITSLLDIISSDSYNTETILKYLKTNLTEIDIFETSEIENFCYMWDINGKKWKDSFIPENQADEIEFIKLEEIRRKIINPIEKLKQDLKEDVTVDEVCQLIYSFIKNTGAEEKIQNIILFYTQQNKISLANEQKKIWDFFIDIIDDIHSTLKDKIMPLKQFSMLFKELLTQTRYSVPPQTLDSVTVAPVMTARLSSPKIIFILGANEEKFPLATQTGDIFSYDERRILAGIGLNENNTREEVLSNAKLSAYKALSSAGEKLYISYPLTSLKGQNEYRSSVIGNIETMFPLNDEIIIHESDISEDYYAVTQKSAYYHLMQNKKNADVSVASIMKVLEEFPEYKNKIEYVYTRSRQEEIYRLSDRDIMDKLVNFKNFNLSPTGFEIYNKCHFMYFCKYCLNLKQRNKIEMNPINLGTLIHQCLKVLLSDKNKDGFIEMTKEELRKIIKEVCEEYKNNLFKNDFKHSSRIDLIYEKIINQILIVAIHLQEELRNTDFVPEEFEVNINKEIGFVPLIIKGKNGKITFGGIVDRIDLYTAEDGKKYIRIIDYKSSQKKVDKFFMNNGINMQTILYLFAVTQNGKFSDSVPSGILYSPVTLSMPEVEFRNNKSDDINLAYIDKKLCFSGLILKEDGIPDAMDKSKGKYIKTKGKKNTIPPVLSFSSEQFEKLKDFSLKKISEMNEKLYNGDIEINPLINKKHDIDSCKYCEFSDICGNSPVYRCHDGFDLQDPETDLIFDNQKEED